MGSLRSPAPARALRRGAASVVAALGVVSAGATEGAGEAGEGGEVRVPSFRTEVMAVLSKGGCNAGGCHGAPSGKGGFQLSLFGSDPARDYAELRESGTRLDPSDPEASWLLRKPVNDLKHEGGARFSRDSEAFRILHDWIRAGAPDDADAAPVVERLEVTPLDAVIAAPRDSAALTVIARFSDGSERDVTRWAVYEPSDLQLEVTPDGVARAPQPMESTVVVRYLDRRVPVRLAFIPERPGFAWSGPPPRNVVDEHVHAKLRRLRLNPAPPASDTVFVRRAHLDLLGRPPTAAEARAFVASPLPSKREALVDELLERPEFAEFWALKWADLLKAEEKTLDSNGVRVYHAWIRDVIAQGRPIDGFVREILAGRGSTYANPPANFYRALRDPATRAEAVAQVFLGTRLQCAKCHNHPFERWTQDDYYRFSALFDGIDYEIVENNRRDQYDKHQFIGEQIVKPGGERVLKDPRTDQLPEPGLLDPAAPALEPAGDRFEQLAEWVTGGFDGQFARVQANRIWYHLTGIGIVDPVDDFRSTNPASNPALLEALADELAASGYDLRHMIRMIMRSATYQAAGAGGEAEPGAIRNFARAAVTRLSAEQLLDAIRAVLDVPAKFKGYDDGRRAVAVPGVEALTLRSGLEPGDHFLKLFGKPQRLLASDMERSREATLAQVFELTSSGHMQEMLTRGDNRLAGLLHPAWGARGAVRELYWTALSRPPSPDEEEALSRFIDESGDRRQAIEDVVWSLINAKEFVFRH